MTRKRVLLLGALLAVAGVGAPTTMILMSDHRDATDPPPAPPRIATQPVQPAVQPIVAGTPAPVSAAPVTEVVVTTLPPALATPVLSTPALSTPAGPATTSGRPDPLTIRKPVVQVSAPPPLSTGDPVAQPPPLTGDDDEPPG
ncbi:hypothetical protein [Actinoplanes sp. NBRC 103695]|uniref:hypothetical protein n=1 Tax=Actinoplanes sp. NBRC 103695 TaxID=3032202 RepID=UPI0024A3D437|nr:hypothetical protein [Actinoplanes sp. NBRC 103695]GLY95768.1 hypothetical protein Acsp02_30230 [Actinoplanes sp. NBRC 103695]